MLREVFWDTNCYRELGIVAIEKGQPAFHKLLEDILNAEEEKEIKVKISYLVLCEMFSHLADDPSSRVYKQCKFGLYALLKHCRSNPDNLLRSFEHEMIYFFQVMRILIQGSKKQICSAFWSHLKRGVLMI